MNEKFSKLGFYPSDILLPKKQDMTKWAVVACDQYTSQPEYWERVDQFVGDAPSTLRLILPESKLESEHVEEEIQKINQTMEQYLEEGRLRELEDANRAKRPGYELLVKGALLRFLALLIAQGRQQLPAETADTQRLKTVLQWLSAHYADPLRVADAAGVCSFSASHFMRWFRQMTGQSFIAFLNEYRLNTAAEALQTTDETVLTIASRCGFENLSYFNRAFKAHFGMTPRDYRKK